MDILRVSPCRSDGKPISRGGFEMRKIFFYFTIAGFLAGGCATVKTVPEKSLVTAFQVESRGLASAKVINGSGQEIRTLWTNKTVSDGSLAVTWNGMDQTGNPAPAGGYQVVLDVARVDLQPINSFGGQGSTPGNFLNPGGLCAYPQGARLTLAVADTGNQRVQLLTDTGGFLQAAGLFGVGQDALNQPTDVDWDGQFLTVCDSQNRRLARFDDRGNYIGQIQSLTGLQASISTKVVLDFQNPQFIQKGGGGDFWVADTGHGILFHITNTGGVLEELGNPFPLTLDGPFIRFGDGFWVRSGKNQVQILDVSGNVEKTLSPEPAFQSVEGIAAVGGDYVLVGDSGRDLVYFLDKEGKVFQSIAPPSVEKPGAMALWQDQLFMVDASSNEIHHFQLVSQSTELRRPLNVTE